MRLAWMTDIHLDMAGDISNKISSISRICDECEGIIITGDVSISSLLIDHLSALEEGLQKPIYFVLGNHDYYGSNIGVVRRNVVNHCNNSSFLKYMSCLPYIKLKERSYLLGHDGWYDAQNGNPYSDSLLMNDWLQIADFNSAIRSSYAGKLLNKNVIIGISQRLAQLAANHIANSIKKVAKDSEHIIVMTHVPPFKETFNAAEKYKGMSSSDILPWYTSKIIGDTLFSAAKAYPHIKFTVLSGHVHSHYDDDLLNNLNVKVGRAIYGNPQVISLISV